jgi:hypothetical protein
MEAFSGTGVCTWVRTGLSRHNGVVNSWPLLLLDPELAESRVRDDKGSVLSWVRVNLQSSTLV